MFKPKSFIIKLLKGTACMVFTAVPPLIAYILTASAMPAIIVCGVQTLIIAIALTALNKRIANWVWLIVVAASAIIFAPILSSNAQYLYYSVFPLLDEPLQSETVKFIRPSLPRYYVAENALIDYDKEIWYRETETYQVEDRNNPGHYRERTSVTEFHFVPLFWNGQGEGESFGLLEYNDQVKASMEKTKYSRYTQPLPKLYLLHGTAGLKKEAANAYSMEDSAQKFTLTTGYPVFNHAFFSEEEMRTYIRSRIPLPIIFFLVLWTGFVAIPAFVLTKKES